jgi:type I restriction enzyme M protein
LKAIVWLYRGKQEKFLALIKRYFGSLCGESALINERLFLFEGTLKTIRSSFDTLSKDMGKVEELAEDKRKSFADAEKELNDLMKPYETDRKRLISEIEKFRGTVCKNLPQDNKKQHSARKAFEPTVEHIRGLIKQVDLLYKLVSRVGDIAHELASIDVVAEIYDRRTVGRLLKQLDEQRKAAVEQMKQTTYFFKQIAWLQERFPDAKLRDVLGLVKLVDVADIKAADWSLTPGRYVGVTPAEVDEDFDFEQALRDMHVELADLNKEAAELAAKIQENFEELGI